MKRLFAFLIGLILCQAVTAGALPYDEAADAKTSISQALTNAQQTGKQVLLVFGANWCKDCRELDRALHGKSEGMIGEKLVVVKVNIGNFDKNLDIAEAYGNPIKKGIPAAVIINAKNEVLYSTKAGELADARSMGDSGIYDFFSNVLATHL